MIPKTIHYAWFGGGEIPTKELVCIESWSKICPDYNIVLWNEDNYNVYKNHYMAQAYHEKKWGFVPDYARLDIIFEHGGIYLDTDVELLKSFDNFLSYPAFAGIEMNSTQGGVNINLGLGFGSEAGNPVIKAMLNAYQRKSFINTNGKIDLTPSPIIQTETLKKLGFVSEDICQELRDITIFSSEYFCPTDYATGDIKISENTYSIHHYSSSWLDPIERDYISYRRKYIKIFKNESIAKALSLFVVYYKEYGVKWVLELVKRFRKK